MSFYPTSISLFFKVCKPKKQKILDHSSVCDKHSLKVSNSYLWHTTSCYEASTSYHSKYPNHTHLLKYNKTAKDKASPGQIPETRVHYDQVWFGTLFQILQYGLHIGIVASCSEIKPDQKSFCTVLPDFLVVNAIVHSILAFPAPFYEQISSKAVFSLKDSHTKKSWLQ